MYYRRQSFLPSNIQAEIYPVFGWQRFPSYGATSSRKGYSRTPALHVQNHIQVEASNAFSAPVQPAYSVPANQVADEAVSLAG